MRLMVLAVLLALICPSRGRETSSASPQSPSIESLQRQLSSSQKVAVDEFWAPISIRCCPLVEADSTDPNYSLVTFVWKGAPGTKNVVVISPLALVDFGNAIMQRVGDTEIRFRTYRMRNDTRMTYRFAVNDTLVPFEKEKNFFSRMKSWETDPGNPRTFDIGGGVVASVLELAGAPTNKWTRASDTAAKGKITKQEFQSEVLHNQRPAWIYTPANFESDKPYPLLVIMDGESYTSLIPMPTILDNLLAAKAIPPVVAVLLGNGPGEARDHEMDCTRLWADAMVKEVLPWLRLQQHLRFAGNITIIGDSLTGLAAGCAAHDYPDIFHKVIS
jgi:hypothetical protein